MVSLKADHAVFGSLREFHSSIFRNERVLDESSVLQPPRSGTLVDYADAMTFNR